MLITNFVTFVVTISFFYMAFYNITLAGFFWIINSNIILQLKTLYSLNAFSFNSFYLTFITIFLFSLAGVPPFTGFFNKIFIVSSISQYGFFLLYFLLFVILILGLYFYMQNLRFIHSTNPNHTFRPFLNNERVLISLHYYLIIVLFLLINGFFFVEDIVHFFSWLVC
jgi:NADH-quinone oxidoreductase subunit N